MLPTQICSLLASLYPSSGASSASDLTEAVVREALAKMAEDGIAATFDAKAVLERRQTTISELLMALLVYYHFRGFSLPGALPCASTHSRPCGVVAAADPRRRPRRRCVDRTHRCPDTHVQRGALK